MEPFLTGSRVYGPLNDESDWDIVMTYDKSSALRRVLNLAKVETLDGNIYDTGFYFSIGDKVINIIEVGDGEYNEWSYATKKMKKHGTINDKKERIALFKHFRNEEFDNNLEEEVRR